MKRTYVYAALLFAAGCYTTQMSACDFGKGPTPLPSPSPAPSAPVTPSPTASPSATPTATPTPLPSVQCVLPKMPDCGGNGCCNDKSQPMFNDKISIAQAALRESRPDIFNQDGSIKVGELTYVDLLARTLMIQNPGMCATAAVRENDSISKDEIAIKVDNTESQNVDVIIGGSNQPFVGGRFTCTPASF